jgi:hypothetical protein
MAATGSIRVVKQFTYRGNLRSFSNRYFFTGHTPSGSTEWDGLSNALTALEKACFKSLATGGAKVIATFGYAIGSDVPVYSHTYALDGTLAPASYAACPGDVAALVRYSTAARSTKNHPIYAFNYYHAVGVSTSDVTANNLATDQKTALQALATAWVNGISDGTNFYSRTTEAGHNATGSTVEVMVTHRDLPR